MHVHLNSDDVKDYDDMGNDTDLVIALNLYSGVFQISDVPHVYRYVPQ